MTDREGTAADAILKKLLASPHFSNARRLSEFLRFLVLRAAAGSSIDERLIASEIYGRDPDYDPTVDSIVRVEANRLRAKLRDYYEAEGRDDAVHLRLPADSYIPVFENAPQPAPAPAPERRTSLLVTAAIALFAATTMATLIPFRTQTTDPRRSIAVLPFATAGSMADKDYVGDGLTEQITSQIGRSGKLQVAARRSSQQFKPGDDIRRVGERLHVDLLLEGSVRFAGDRIGAVTRLYNTHTGGQIWTRDFDRPAAEVLTLQNEISTALAGALQLGNGDSGTRAALGWTNDSEALDLYLQARYLFNSRKPENLWKSIGLYNAALKKDPQFALAYAGLAQDYVVLGANEDQDVSQMMPLARQAVTHALALEPTLPEALLTKAATAEHPDFETAERSYRAAIAANPSNANAHHWLGLNLLAIGRFSEAEAEIRQAQLLDPLSLHIGANLGAVYFCSRRYQDAVDQARKILALDPHLSQALTLLAHGYEGLGRYAEAEEALAGLVKGDNCAGVMADLGHIYAVSGRPEKALATIEALTRLAQKRHVSPHHIAFIQAGLGKKNEALALLEMSYEQHDAPLAFLRVDPRWDPLRGDARFRQLLQALSLDK